MTHAPERFNEFFNQRRRWIPSTLANIMDLLQSYRTTVKINDNISYLYMCYQGLLMISTILGPATILLMMAGAFNAVMEKLDKVETGLRTVASGSTGAFHQRRRSSSRSRHSKRSNIDDIEEEAENGDASSTSTSTDEDETPAGGGA
nr:hypothetical protein BaRGS_022656 [Batillaria attramentaria]